MSESHQVIRSRRVVIGDEVRPAAIAIREGVIAAIGDYDDLQSLNQPSDFGDAIIMPGIVDTHVHINQPGRTDWEGFASATKAAAAGGVTTLIEMPLNSIPAVTTLAAFSQKMAAAKDKLSVDVGFWGGVVPGNVSELQPLYQAGVFGFKCFLVPSGVPEFDAVSESALRTAMPELTALGATLLVHSELPGQIAEALPEIANADPRQYATWLRSRPASAEEKAIALLIRLSKEFATRVHIVHLSSATSVPLLQKAKADGVNITVETCPHYLAFAAEEVPDGATEFKCAPPIRERKNQEQLWEALRGGVIDLIASDHSPAPLNMKCTDSGDFIRAWGGIASLQLSLPIMWTHARERGFDIAALARWLCRGPAQLAGLKRKGEIKPGFDADFVVWKPEESFTVDTQLLYHRHKLTPYAGKTLYGVVQTTILRGREIYASGQFVNGATGGILERGKA